MIIIAVLLAVAIPSYVGYKERAERHVAATNIRVAIPAVEAWHADHGTYTGMTQAALRMQIDAAVNLSQNPTILGGGTGYCVQSDSNGRSAGGEQTHRYTGPSVDTTPVAGSC